MKKVGDSTWYDDDEIALSTDSIEEPGYADDDDGNNSGCRKSAEDAASVLLVVLAIGILLAA